MRDMLLVLDFDHMAARMIARKLRAERICCKILPGDAPAERIAAQEPLGLILAGSALGTETVEPAAGALSSAPVLALSSMAAWLCAFLGGTPGDVAIKNEIRRVTFTACPLLEGLEAGDRMVNAMRTLTLSSDMKALSALEETGETVGFSDASGRLLGMQMEIEQHDPEGDLLLANFALNICGCTPWWDEDAFVLRSVQEIKRLAGEGSAICAMTGGLNSGVSALLAYRALGARLKCVFVDTGLLRDAEGDKFMAFYHDQMGLDITRVDAEERFLTALSGVRSGEEKRRVIGALLKEILTSEREKTEGLSVLIRGTSYSDVLNEAAQSDTEEGLTLIEPVRDLFKDEIRQVGEYLGMPADIISRQPFPGSGLAPRIMGEVTRERLKTLRHADEIFRDEVLAAGQAKRLWQFFAVLSPAYLDQGDIISLRAVHATDGAMAYAARLYYDVLESVVKRILTECPSVRRVVYDMTPSTNYSGIEWQ